MRIRRKLESRSIQSQPSKVEFNQSFQQIVEQKSHQFEKRELDDLLIEITDLGEQLARFRRFSDLAKFKRLIRSFLEKTVYNGLTLKKTYPLRFGEQNHRLSIVEEIDNQLVKLTEQMMDQEQKSVDLLAIIGEIKGLLINLYM